jgi:hypothetical protein
MDATSPAAAAMKIILEEGDDRSLIRSIASIQIMEAEYGEFFKGWSPYGPPRTPVAQDAALRNAASRRAIAKAITDALEAEP